MFIFQMSGRTSSNSARSRAASAISSTRASFATCWAGAPVYESAAHTPCAETHQLDGDLLAELTRAEEQHAGGMCPQRRAQRAMGGEGTCKSAGFSHGLIVPPGGYRISTFDAVS